MNKKCLIFNVKNIVKHDKDKFAIQDLGLLIANFFYEFRILFPSRISLIIFFEDG